MKMFSFNSVDYSTYDQTAQISRPFAESYSEKQNKTKIKIILFQYKENYSYLLSFIKSWHTARIIDTKWVLNSLFSNSNQPSIYKSSKLKQLEMYFCYLKKAYYISNRLLWRQLNCLCLSWRCWGNEIFFMLFPRIRNGFAV